MLCQTLNLRPEAVKHDYIHQDDARMRAERGQTASQHAGNPAKIKLNAELRVMLFVVANFQFFSELRSSLSVDDFEDSLAKGIFIVLEECFRRDTVSMSSILAQFDDGNVKQLISTAVTSGEYSTKFTDGMMRDSILRIRKKSLERQRNAVLNQIRQMQVVTLDDQTRMETLLTKKMNIDFELKGQ
jgi:DNA primase